MSTTQELVEELIERYPDDADDLKDALEIFQKQRLGSCDRLAKLNDSQWQRLGLPLGIESMLREEVEAMIQEGSAQAGGAQPPAQQQMQQAAKSRASAQKAMPRRTDRRGDQDGELPLEPFEPASEGMRRRGGSQRESSGGGSNSSRGTGQHEGGERKGLLSPMDLTPPADLELLWQQLLEDTLPPDKRSALHETWEQAGTDHDRYMMFLEYSSYLRKPEITEEEKEERRKQLEPLMKEFGIRPEAEGESFWEGALIWFFFVAIILFIAGLVYYFYATPETMHDSQAL